MRRWRSFVTMTLAILITTGALAQSDSAKTLAGRWDGQRPTEGRVDNVGLIFTPTDNGMTGDVLLNNEVFDKMTNITFVGNTVTFTIGDMDFSGAIDGKTMKLTVSSQGRELWTMTVTKKAALAWIVTAR